jgi:hypothetical protein
MQVNRIIAASSHAGFCAEDERGMCSAARATSEGLAYVSCFSIGGVTVELSGDGKEDVNLVPSLAAFRVRAGESDINISTEWVSCIRPVPRRRIFDSGATWQLYQDELGLQFDICAPHFGEWPYKRLFIDHGFCRATLQMSNECHKISSFSGGSLDYPLDELVIMHRLTQEKGIELHGAGIVRRNGEANLFVGHSGAGKSTTTRLWAETEDVEVLSDDRIIVRRDDGVENQISRFARNGNSGFDDNPKRNDDPKNDNSKQKMRMYGTPWHGEGMYASPNSALLTRIFILEHGHGNILTRLSASQAVSDLFARSFVPFYCHEYVESALQFLEEVADAVPCYRYAFEPQLSAVERILEFRD